MSNFTFQIKDCKIFEYNSKQTKAWGKLCWTDGTADMKVKFETTYPEVIKTIEANKHPEKSFRASGSMTVNNGYGDHAGKVFQNYVLTELEVVK